MKVAEAVVKVLERANIDVVFGIPGKWINPVYNAMSESKIKHILMRSEKAAAHAADGYARVTGKPGVCLATAGPGGLGLTLGVATAYKDHTPLLAITGQVPLKLRGRRVAEEFNIVEIFKHITKLSIEILEPTKAYEQIFYALKTAVNKCPGPVHISLPEDIQLRRIGKVYAKEFTLREEHVEVEDDIVNEVSTLINSSEKPIILAGQGVILSGAEKELYDLAKKSKIPVATTLMARGIIPEDNPLNLGFAGYYGSIEANRALAESDLVLALGCSLSYNTMFYVNRRKKVIQVDVEEKNFNKHYTTLPVKANVKHFIAKIIDKVKPRSMLWIRGGKQHYRVEDSNVSKVMKKLRETFNDSRTVYVLDIGLYSLYSISYIKANKPRTIIFPGNLATLGFSLPAAIGVKTAKPDSNVVAIMGDGAFYISSSELGVLKQFNIPVVIVVYNNRCYGLTMKFQKKSFKRSFAVHLGDFSVAKIAEAYGIESYVFSKPEEFEKTMFKNVDEPLLIEFLLNNS